MDRQGQQNQPGSSSSSRSVNFDSQSISFRVAVAQNLIERCLQKYMTRNEVIDTVFKIAKIEPRFTEIVWQELERQNSEFFRAYHIRLKLKDQIITFNNLLRQQDLMTKHLQAQQSPPGLPTGSSTGLPTGNPPAIQQPPTGVLTSGPTADRSNLPGLPTGNPPIQKPPTPFPSADHGNFLSMKMNSGNDGRMVRNENSATNSQFLHLPSDMSRGFDSASKSHFKRIPQSLRLGWDGEPKSSTGVPTSDPTANCSNLPGNPAIQKPPTPFPSADHGNFLSMQMNSGNDGRMVRNENLVTNSQFLHLPSDMSRGFDSASKSHFERIPLRLGLDGEPKSSTGVLTSGPTADCSNLPGLPTGNPAIQQPPIPFPSADHGNFPGMQMNSGNEMVRNEKVASNSQFLHLPSDKSRGFDSASKSHSERIPQSLRLGFNGEPKSPTGVLTSGPTADRSNLPGLGRRNAAIQQSPIPSPSAGHGNFLGMQENSGNEMMWERDAALYGYGEFVDFPSEMSWTFDSEFKSYVENPMLNLDGHVPESLTRMLPSLPTADLCNLPVPEDIESYHSSQFYDDSSQQRH